MDAVLQQVPTTAPPPARRRVAGPVSRVLCVVALLGLAVGGTLTLLAATDDPLYVQGQEAVGLGFGLLAISAALGLLPVRQRDENMPSGAGLRATALFLQLLTVIAVTALVLAALQRLGAVRVGAAFLVNGIPFAVVLLGGVAAAAHLIGLGRPDKPPRTAAARILVPVELLAALGLVAVGILLALDDPSVEQLTRLHTTDASMVFLGAGAVIALAIHSAQSLPSALRILVAAETAALPGGRARSVVLPIVIAFSLLVLSLLLFLLFGVGVVGVLGQVSQSPALIGVFVFILAAVVGSLLAASRLARREEIEAPLYRPYTDPRAKLERDTLWLSLGAGAVLAAFAWATSADLTPVDPAAWIHFASIAFLVAIGPYGFLVAKEASRVRRLEERFPDFLREIASSHRGGLTLAESVTVSARADYGPLTAEVKRMADQVAWNIPFTEALQRFSDRVQTPLVQRAVNLILEADRSGGSSADVLLAAARDAREIKTLENERRITMSLYTIIIYITFFVFLGVAAVLYGQFVPQLVASSQATATARAGQGAVNGIGGETLKASQFQMFYFLAALVQAVGDGIVAGLMGTGRAVLGLRHSFLMVLFTYIVFVVLLR